MRKICFLLIAIVLISGCIEEESVYVARVVDGDTFETSGGEKIRLLGINAPEKGEYYYGESTDKLRELIGNRYVTMERDGESKDWYGRSLRYVYIGDELVNAEMIEGGYARLYLLDSKKYENTLTYAEDYAKERHLGIWKYDN